jgi:hypothetical protein
LLELNTSANTFVFGLTGAFSLVYKKTASEGETTTDAHLLGHESSPVLVHDDFGKFNYSHVAMKCKSGLQREVPNT